MISDCAGRGGEEVLTWGGGGSEGSKIRHWERRESERKGKCFRCTVQTEIITEIPLILVLSVM